MSLRTALRYIISISCIALLVAGIWEWNAYTKARRQVGQALADNTLLGREARELAVALVGTLVLLALIGLLALFAFDRYVRRPINQLREQLNIVSAGNRNHVIEMDNPLEISELARDANQMRISLNAALDDANRAHESLELNDPTTALLFSELKASGFDLVPQRYDIAEHISSSHGVISGDWWDVFRCGVRTDELAGDPGTAIAIVDIAGHDTKAGITGLKLKATLATALAAGFKPGVIFHRISQLMADLNATHATAFVVVFPDDVSLPITWVNAGHPAPMLLRADGSFQTLTTTGPILAGIGGYWEEGSCFFNVGDRLLLYTDGLEETKNEIGEQFGMERIEKTFRESPSHLASSEVIDRVVSAAQNWSTTWRGDDVTVVSVMRKFE